MRASSRLLISTPPAACGTVWYLRNIFWRRRRNFVLFSKRKFCIKLKVVHLWTILLKVFSSSSSYASVFSTFDTFKRNKKTLIRRNDKLRRFKGCVERSMLYMLLTVNPTHCIVFHNSDCMHVSIIISYSIDFPMMSFSKVFLPYPSAPKSFLVLLSNLRVEKVAFLCNLDGFVSNIFHKL